MRVVYSICARFGGSGIGYTAYHAACGIYRAGMLMRLFASSNAQEDIPARLIRHWSVVGRVLKYLAAKDTTGLFDYIVSVLFDLWTAMYLPRCDLFHGWSGMCLYTLRRARRFGAVTVVERASSHPNTYLRLLRDEYARWNVRSKVPMWNYRRLLRELEEVDYVTIPSPFVRDSMLNAGASPDKLIEIPFGVDLSRFHPAQDGSTHPFRVAFAGQVSLLKGVPYLVGAWQQLGWKDSELWIIGAIAPDVRYMLAGWRNLPGVRLIPYSRHLETLLSQCDVFVFPSIQEGSALVTYEALACGLPVITTPNAGSVVRDGQEGFIVPIRDVDALCDRMQRLREDVALRRAMSHAALERARAFPWTAYQERLVAAYLEKLSVRRLQSRGEGTR
ncbi:MAG: glycosyltransferase family 4 protein [Anaerolineae bacterium]|nr:glycosyltransferase family 4 protein [Anaerolineae bacterium]MDW8072175.1 glycosyltransferase family 4 protein [Anaerolineae bacterium]